MRICTKCHFEKPESDFYFQSKQKNQLHTECKMCYKAHRRHYAAEHYRKYGDAYRYRAKTRRAKVKNALRAQMIAYLTDKSCEICGENDSRVLDFDHLDPKQKIIGVSNALTKGFAWELILAEIQKCRILCANCHRRHTATQQGWYRIPPTSII